MRGPGVIITQQACGRFCLGEGDRRNTIPVRMRAPCFQYANTNTWRHLANAIGITYLVPAAKTIFVVM